MEELETKRRGRGPYLPLELRLRLYDKVLELRRQGLSYDEIAEAIYILQGTRVTSSCVGYWVRGEQHPLGKVNKFEPKSSTTLAYIIGVRLGDGYLRNDGHSHEIALMVSDYEFAMETGRSLAKLVSRKKPYAPWWNRNRHYWCVKCCSILLYEFLRKPLEELKPYIEHCRNCVAAFLRAFFDSEGDIARKMLRVSNTDKRLLLYTQRLLRRYFGIESTGPHRRTRAGKRFCGTNGKVYRIKKPCCYLYIRARSLPRFHRYIGFLIKRKQQRLTEAIRK